jgi:hypothetical protein
MSIQFDLKTRCDNDGNPQVMAWRLISNCRDAEEAEALACLEGVKLLHHWLSHV